MRRIAKVGVACCALLLVVGAGACSKKTATPNVTPTIGAGEGELDLIAWIGYVESGKNNKKFDWVTPFQTETGCIVKDPKFADTSDQMVTLMRQAGGTQYDGVSASGDASNRLIAGGDVAAVDPNLFPDFANTMELLKAPKHNTVGGKHYGVPYMWGANLLMYNTTLVKPAPTSWDITWEKNSPYKGKVVGYDSPIFIADAALYLKAHNPQLGITNPYELTAAQLDAAITLLKQQKPLIGKYWSLTTDETDGFANKSLVVGTAWPVNYNTLLTDKKPVKAIIPSEGATGWADTWMMSAHAKHPNCMLKWMQYTMRADVQAKVAEYYGASPSNVRSCDLLRTAVGTIADEVDHCGDATVLSNLALWQTPVADCGDSRGMTCIDYSTWTTRWQEVRGS